MSETNTPQSSGPREELPADLDGLRAIIDNTDAELLELLNRRAAVSLAVAEAKAPGDPVLRPGREAEILSRLEASSSGPLPPTHLRRIYREILSSSRALQRHETVAYLGPEGTFTHAAARGLLGSSAILEPKESLEAVFAAVDADECGQGLVPLDNSLHGSVVQTFDLFMRYNLHIVAETVRRVRHSLLSRETDLAAVRLVVSHPQALAQCAHTLRELVPQAKHETAESTAAAARRALGEAGTAAVAHVGLLDGLDLRLLASNIEDDGRNITRFVLLGKQPLRETGRNRTSVLFSVGNTPGALAKVLRTVAAAGVNLSKLESRPMRGTPWHYIFFADLDCDLEESQFASLRAQLHEQCPQWRVLGVYPSGGEIVED